ncbi:ABC transporter ATP-binding protein [Paenisporosarcina quisquiliarum]|uniref:ABC transporter ATP-binding protein n=1 Tax=Paenisporosarcina quisquiliarum TaxID=365346 RepID=A0A9X3LHX2_9BACL|nr:ABC transporter ATP-binding protein [Paenisporosarcina quisquiliarum]MCZ8538340.1 ABC transporter ATP-binding protein [Paenisporosarcina quisquiliarum]
MIRINQISKTYKMGKVGLHPMDLLIAPGEIIAFIGGNGAGKSTLIQLLTNILKPTTGTIDWGEQQFSYMPDDLEFPTHVTAWELLKLLGAIKAVEDEKVLLAATTVGLQNHLHQRIETFSKGMKQRLAFAQTLLANEDVMILDEPTNGLDPYWVKWMQTILDAKRKEGKTIIFSTHDISFVERLADKMLFFNEGRVLFQYQAKEWRENPKSLEETILDQLNRVHSSNS